MGPPRHGVFSAYAVAAIARLGIYPISAPLARVYCPATMIATTFQIGSSLPDSPARAATSNLDRAAHSRQEALEDSVLVRRFRSGDDEAFNEIVARYRGRMLSIALRHLRNHSDAEEIAQDTFVRAHRGLSRFRGDSSLSTWLHRIAFNLSRNRHKYNFCRGRNAMMSLDCAIGDNSLETVADLIASEAPSPAREATACEFSAIVTRCMGRLGESQREILMLRNGLSQSYGEIAKALGINIGTVKSRIGRARENLRTLLAEAYPEMAESGTGTGWFEAIRPCGRLAVACA